MESYRVNPYGIIPCIIIFYIVWDNLLRNELSMGKPTIRPHSHV